MDPLPPAQLQQLKHHRYLCDDNSLFNKWFVNRFYTWLIEFVPVNIAPNTLTLVGFVAFILPTWYALASNPLFEGAGHAPTGTAAPGFWLALGLIVYFSLDFLDGKQARRTKSGSPLGELFDHGCDSVTCFVLVMGVISVLELDANTPPLTRFLMASLPSFMFFSAHWLSMNLGYLYFGWLDVSELDLSCVCLFLLHAVKGSGPVHTQVFGRDAAVFLCSHLFPLICAANIARNVFMIFTHRDAQTRTLSYKLSPLPPLLLSIFCAYALYFSPVFESVTTTNPVSSIFIVGLLFSRLTIVTIMSGMTSTALSASLWARFAVPVAMVIFLALCGVISVSPNLLFVLSAYMTAEWLHNAYAVISQFCQFGRISAFKVSTWNPA